MSGTEREAPDGAEMGLLLAGVACVLVAYFMPAVVFQGRGATHGLSIFDKLPLMSLVAFAALGAAVATRLVPNLRRWAEQATIAAIVIALVPAIYGFVIAIDAWSGVRATILQIAGTRSVKIDPGLAYLPLAAGAALMGASLRHRLRRLVPAAA
ncbi:hypothetical protein [Falsiroseomonas oryzae]|uniref:hypothetical protein n=1 Tax=Falsiroseomonas oryzae TaxID=2766473 RepID=UPI0022EA407D|nr:hypothetical protein [Roseomonas sp. MO-31]